TWATTSRPSARTCSGSTATEAALSPCWRLSVYAHGVMTSADAPTVRETDGIQELEGDIRSRYVNHDLFPTRLRDRKWAMKDIAPLGISMSACVPTYMLASSLIAVGMSWWQAVVTIFLGNCVVLLPMVLNAHAGTKYGIPFPVYCRPAFGILGANVPAIL